MQEENEQIIHIFDNVWGDIEIPPFIKPFLDTYEFQRMRYMKQLGACHFVFPSAESSRFSHSLGVFHLTFNLCKNLLKKHPDIVTERDVELISIAALFHDIGHGPFSHLFDECTGTNHEDRSKVILKNVIEKQQLDQYSDSDISYMESVIDPEECTNEWRFRILSSFSGADTDRMDYIIRDSTSTGISVPISANDIRKLINTAYIDKETHFLVYSCGKLEQDLMWSRSHMFERVYLHKTVDKIKSMIKSALKEELEDIATNYHKFIHASDAVLQQVYSSKDLKTLSQRKIIENIYSRNFEHF